MAEDVFGVATDVQLASRRVEEGGRWHATSARQHLIPSLPRSSWSISHAHPPRPSPHGARWAVAQCLAPAVSAPQNARIGAHGRGVSGGVGARTGSMDALSDGPPESCAVGERRAGGPRRGPAGASTPTGVCVWRGRQRRVRRVDGIVAVAVGWMDGWWHGWRWLYRDEGLRRGARGNMQLLGWEKLPFPSQSPVRGQPV